MFSSPTLYGMRARSRAAFVWATRARGAATTIASMNEETRVRMVTTSRKKQTPRAGARGVNDTRIVRRLEDELHTEPSLNRRLERVVHEETRILEPGRLCRNQ